MANPKIGSCAAVVVDYMLQAIYVKYKHFHPPSDLLNLQEYQNDPTLQGVQACEKVGGTLEWTLV